MFPPGDAALYDSLKAYILPEEKLVESNYPVQHPEKRGCAVLFADSKRGSTDGESAAACDKKMLPNAVSRGQASPVTRSKSCACRGFSSQTDLLSLRCNVLCEPDGQTHPQGGVQLPLWQRSYQERWALRSVPPRLPSETTPYEA